MRKKIHIITPIRPGGPQMWGRLLAKELNIRDEWSATHTRTLPRMIMTPFYEPADVVHTSVPITYRLWKKPLILTLRGNFMIEYYYWARMYPRSIRMADIVTVSSHFLKETLRLPNALVIPPSADLPQMPVRQRTDEHTIRILIVTKFCFPQKSRGVLTLLDALSKTKIKKHPISIAILGGGVYLNEIKRESRRCGLPVTFYGFTDPKPFFEQSDIFLYWSKHDNTPIAVLEAMSYGLPVVANNVGAMTELVTHKETGLIANTPDEFTAYVNELFDHPELQRTLGEGARHAILTTFSHARVVPQYESLYRGVIS